MKPLFWENSEGQFVPVDLRPRCDAFAELIAEQEGASPFSGEQLHDFLKNGTDDE